MIDKLKDIIQVLFYNHGRGIEQAHKDHLLKDHPLVKEFGIKKRHGDNEWYGNVNKDRSGNLIIKHNDTIVRFEYSQNRVCLFKDRDYICFNSNNITLEQIREMLLNNDIIYHPDCLKYRIGFDTNGRRKLFMELCRRLDEKDTLDSYNINNSNVYIKGIRVSLIGGSITVYNPKLTHTSNWNRYSYLDYNYKVIDFNVDKTTIPHYTINFNNLDEIVDMLLQYSKQVASFR